MSKTTRVADGVHAISEQLAERLRAYIEAQYHIRDEALIDERDMLLRERRSIANEPYIEATPNYRLGSTIAEMKIPDTARSLLEDLVPMNVGVFSRPYLHQEQAITAFLRDEKDVIVATGTGSGKTETFLFSILGMIAEEASERSATATLPGVRALMLYPMNALVNDQLSRVRRLFGTEAASQRISMGRLRPIRFAAYTGRTPYPGKKEGKKDNALIRPLFDDYYIPLEDRPDIIDKLKNAGKWPAKDLRSFYAAEKAETRTTRTGKTLTFRKWNERLKTGPTDRELMTRHEVQSSCPDLLITNYSMLEYMLLRPIEREIFEQTKRWLESDTRNVFTIVLDEAHLYTGVAGAEVALLLRRLIARLGITRERVRCILTSASFGSGSAAQDEALLFARELTGARNVQKQFELVEGTLEALEEGNPASRDESDLFASFNLANFDARVRNWDTAADEVARCFASLGMEIDCSEDSTLRVSLGAALSRLSVTKRLVAMISGNARSLRSLALDLFPSVDQERAESALSSLLALCSYARRPDGRVFLATRVHMIFRGLPGLYACLDPECSQRRVSGASLLGRLYTDPRVSCGCSRQARVFELLTHRDCGSAFIRAFIAGPNGLFLWNERYERTMIGSDDGLAEIQLLVEREAHAEAGPLRPAWIDMSTGQIQWSDPSKPGFRKVFAPERSAKGDGADISFASCPVCLKSWRADSQRIMDHVTKGEDPFAALVAAQLKFQPESKPFSREFPNGGKKVLLFSDGRQKAARLARDLPRVVEQDVFRQALAVAATRLAATRGEAKLDRSLYVAFLDVLAEGNLVLFDGESRDALERDLAEFIRENEGDLGDVIDTLVASLTPSMQYNTALLRQLCSRFYSLTDTTIGSVVPARREAGRIANVASELEPGLTPDDTDALSLAWIQRCLDNFSFNIELSVHERWQAGGHPSNTGWGTPIGFGKSQTQKFSQILGIDSSRLEAVVKIIAQNLASNDDNGAAFLNPRKVTIDVDLRRSWIQCADCTRISHASLRQHCLYCGSSRTEILDPAVSRYLAARKNYWREPVADAISNVSEIETIAVEEHTAQLSHRDKASVQATTERYELRFQDLLIKSSDRPIDVLSCTTTMEVGIDIGSLVAVGLRNVPPQRSNYQQRAGRAGRRGSSVSTVITYAQNGPHDAYYFNNPETMVAGAPPSPKIKTDNEKIARRHVHSFLLQTFFNEAIDSGEVEADVNTSRLDTALGSCSAFFLEDGPASLIKFGRWVQANVVNGRLAHEIATWLPQSLAADGNKRAWIISAATEYVQRLEGLRGEIRERSTAAESGHLPGADDDDDVSVEGPDDGNLLDFLFDENLLPSYAFPTRLAGFLIEEYVARDEWLTVKVREYPQQAIDKALSEYAPGRLLVVNKKRYRSGGVIASYSDDPQRKAAPLFERALPLIYCTACSFVREAGAAEGGECPVCHHEVSSHTTIQPQVFVPEAARELRDDDSDQDITYATMAQFPVPIGEDLRGWRALGERCQVTYTTDRRLLTVNKGKRRSHGSYGGFYVCDHCGFASPDEIEAGTHDRPYLLPYKRGRRPGRCRGTIREVYLGGVFTTDLLLMRLTLSPPLMADTTEARALRVIEDALYSAAEAIKQAACRHPQLDIGEGELGSGFRINPPNKETGARHADLYLFDASSGGAGYSQIAERYIDEILTNAILLLETCPSDCQTSCQECLRHFHNQHLRDRLDRHLARDFLKVAVKGESPPSEPTALQARRLRPLQRMLELSGVSCSAEDAGEAVPLLVGNRLVLEIRSGVLVPNAQSHSDARGRAVFSISNYDLVRDLPSVYNAVVAQLHQP